MITNSFRFLSHYPDFQPEEPIVGFKLYKSYYTVLQDI